MLMTLPPGSACLAASLFELMSGLKLPWHRRRTTRRVWSDFMLARYSGGGWVSACGAYDWFKYGSRAARRPIDFLEGDTVVACVERLAHKWWGCVVQFFIDRGVVVREGGRPGLVATTKSCFFSCFSRRTETLGASL